MGHRIAVEFSTVACLVVLGMGDDWAGPRSQAARISAPAAFASIAADQFVLLTTPTRFLLQFHSRGETKQVAIPRAWLVPPQEERDEEHEFVSSFQYDNRVTSFAIGDGKIGLQLSSFALMTDGSAQAAAGRDVFLVFDPESAVIEKGLTKCKWGLHNCIKMIAQSVGGFAGTVRKLLQVGNQMA